MTKLVEAIAKSLVDSPEEVVVTETEGLQGTVIELTTWEKSSVSRGGLLRLCVPLLRLQPSEKIKK